MLAGVSHDLRTPLTRIRLQLALMKDNEDAAAIRADLAEMEDMIDAYLSFAAGEGEEEPEETRIETLLDRLVHQTAKAHGYDIQMILPGEPLPAFPVRRKSIQRAFENIISNASPIRQRRESACATAMMRRPSSLMIMVPAFPPNAAPMPSVPLSGWKSHATGKPAAPALGCQSPAISCWDMAAS